jgi:hypothetical protein
MKYLSILLTLQLICLMSLAQNLTGSYAGDIAGTPAVLQLKQSGAQLSGQIDASGYLYTLQGNANQGRGSGTLSDPQTMGSMQFELALAGQQINFYIVTTNIFTGQQQKQLLVFAKEGKASPNQTSTAQSKPGHSQSGKCKNCDQALVGYWLHTNTLTSGDFSTTTQLKLYIYENGTYAYGNARTMAGGHNEYDYVGADTGQSDDVTRGKWKTQNQIIYVMENGTSQWYPYARYEVSGNSMLMTFDDGSTQYWER